MSGPWDYYLTGNVSKDHGWAEHNPSRIAQFFGKVGYETERDNVDISLTAADNRLEGTQTLPLSFLDDRRQAYTFPDINKNQLVMLAVKGSHFVTDERADRRQRLSAPLPQRQRLEQRQRQLRRSRPRHRGR